jgi:hypothetical protein
MCRTVRLYPRKGEVECAWDGGRRQGEVGCVESLVKRAVKASWQENEPPMVRLNVRR